MGGMLDRRSEEIGNGGVQIHRSGEPVDIAWLLTGPPNQERNPAEFTEYRCPRLSENVVLTEVVPVIGAQHDAGRFRQPRIFNGREQLAEPAVNHGELGSVVGADVPGSSRVQLSAD